MGLKRTKLLDIKNVTGISTVGIFTVGITDCTGPVGVASTSYITGIGDTNYQILRVNLIKNETYFFEPVYPIVLVDRESIVVSVSGAVDNGSGIGTQVNFQILGDTDV